MPSPRPPEVAGLPTPRSADAPRLAAGRLPPLHDQGQPREPAAVRGAVGRVVAGLPLVVVVQAVLLGSRRSRYYLSPARDAVLAIRATRQGWLIQDHQSRRPGTGAGAALRSRLLPALTAAADHQFVAICTTAAIPGLAGVYAAELPGLSDVGRAWPRGRCLHRAPGGSGIAAPPGPWPAASACLKTQHQSGGSSPIDPAPHGCRRPSQTPW